MRLRNTTQKTASVDELLALEAEEHDRIYSAAGSDLPSLLIKKERFWRINDHVYKRGAYIRGYRKRMMFQALDLPNIAGKKVLDVGCGIGQHSIFMAMHGAVVEGFDLSAEGLRVAREVADANGVSDRCNFRQASVTDMPYEDETFDLILFNAVLHHVIKYPNVSDETFRVLKPGGRVVFAEGLRDNPLYRAARTMKDFIRGNEQDAGDVDLQNEDLFEFVERYEDVRLERRCLTEGIKQVIARPNGSGAPARLILYVAAKTDDVLLRVFPALRQYCSEVVGSMTKPAMRPAGGRLTRST